MSKKLKIYSIKIKCTPKSTTEKNVRFKPAFRFYRGIISDDKNSSKQEIEKSVISQIEAVLNNDTALTGVIISAQVIELTLVNYHFTFHT